MKFESGGRGRGYEADPPRHQRRHERGGHGHSRRHRSQNVAAGLPPYYPPGEESGDSMELPPHHNQPYLHRRPPSVASVGAWIKAKSSNIFNQADPFGAMNQYLSAVRRAKGGGHRRHRRTHRDDGLDRDVERRHRRHRHHRRRDDDDIEMARRQYEDGNIDQTYPQRASKGGSHYYVEGLPVDLRNADIPDSRDQSSSFSGDGPAEVKVYRKRRRSKTREGNDLQRRDRVVVVCFIAVNCLLAAVGLAVAILAGLANWHPDVYKPFYKSEVERVFQDMINLPSKCGKRLEHFSLNPAKIIVGIFDKICGAGIALTVISVYALIIPLIASRTPKLQTLHVVLHIIYIVFILALTAVTATYLCIYFQNVDSIEADMRIKAKSLYIQPFQGNLAQTCDPISNFVNFIHRYFRCCGVDDGHDFDEAEDFPGTYVDNGSQRDEADGTMDDMEKVYIPLSCCRLGRYYDPVDPVTPSLDNPRGTTQRPTRRGYIIDLCRRTDYPMYGFSDRTSYMRTGCWPVVKEFFTPIVRIGLIILGVFCLIMLFAATLSFLQTRLC